jgi:hypothetical protein
MGTANRPDIDGIEKAISKIYHPLIDTESRDILFHRK